MIKSHTTPRNNKKISTNIKAKLRKKTLTMRINTLMIRPCQSVCPNIGTNKFLSHRPGAKERFASAKIFFPANIKRAIPVVYHQIGK